MSTPHAHFEELMAGYALSALEPEDEQAVLRHLPSCAACERDLAVHRETLAHLAYAGDSLAPPPSLWDGIRREVVATSGAAAFQTGHAGAPRRTAGSSVVDLTARRLSRRRAAAWVSVAAAVAAAGVLGVGQVRDLRHQQARSDRVAAAIRAVETSPARTVPLKSRDGHVAAVAVVQADRVSLIVDGLGRNDAASSIYVLWGQAGIDPATALATFDVRDGRLDVVRDVALRPAGSATPELFLITKEPGRTPPDVSRQPTLATGRAT